MPQHRVKMSMWLQPQTMYHLRQLAKMAGFKGDIGRVIDKLVRTYQAEQGGNDGKKIQRDSRFSGKAK